MSRVVAGERLLGSREKEQLRRQMQQLAAFCGVQVLTYCILSNHFHLLVRVPPESETRQLGLEELERRVRALYPNEQAQGWISRLRGETAEATRERLLGRMGDVSQYLRALKHRFSVWYNRTHNRYGTLWAERFRSVLVEPGGRALLTVACYIDLNPVRAGLCTDPKEYRWSGYAEAVAGGRRSREGLLRVLESGNWGWAQRQYRLILFGRGHHTELGGAGGIPSEKLETVRRNGGGLSLPQLLRCRVRYFSAGAAIGSKAYVQAVMHDCGDYLTPVRKRGPARVPAAAFGDLYTLRNLQRHRFSPG